jgi:hypothetical protein
MCPKTESHDTVLVSLVGSRKLFGEVSLGDISAAGVEDVDDELAACQKSVGDELACSQGNRCSVGLDKRISISNFHRVIPLPFCPISPNTRSTTYDTPPTN